MANDKTIWDAMLIFIGNPYGTAGLMGNLKAESNLQDIGDGGVQGEGGNVITVNQV